MVRFLLVPTILTAALPVIASAQFVPLVGIPGIGGADLTTEIYINALYTLSISVAAFLAVVKLIFAGVQYTLSDIVTSKEAAKKDIQGAIVGLLIVIGAVMILREINPRLLNFNFLENAPTPIGVTPTFRVTNNFNSVNTGSGVVTNMPCNGDCDAVIERCKNFYSYNSHLQEGDRVVCNTSTPPGTSANTITTTGDTTAGIAVIDERNRSAEAVVAEAENSGGEVLFNTNRSIDTRTQATYNQNCKERGGSQIVYIMGSGNTGTVICIK